MKTVSLLLGCALVAPVWADENPVPLAAPRDTRPATAELSAQPLRLPNGQSAGLLAGSWLVAVDDDWGFGPTVLGTAKGNLGGVFVFGVTGQRRGPLGSHTHLAANLTLGAGGGLSSPALRFGGGFMVRPELQVRQEWGPWYLGAGLAHTRFPSGNVRDTTWTLTLGRMDDFRAFAPSDVGRPGRTHARGGVGFDEMALSGGYYTTRGGSRNREGQPLRERLGRAGADARQYIAPDAWWGVEAAGAAKGGIDGYMEVLLNAGTDWALFHPQLRLGVQGGVGLGGGGGVDTGSGRLWRVGPTLRWITPWGPALRLDANRTQSMNGRFSAQETRLSLVLPLEGRRSTDELGRDREDGIVRQQILWGGVQHHNSVRFKDGSQQAVTKALLGVNRELGPHLYGAAQGNAAASGKAGAYAIGLFGVGLQSSPRGSGAWRWRAGVEGLVGAAGGGGVAVGGGAVGQTEAWVQWEGTGPHERLRVRLGAGQWGTLRGNTQRAPFVGLSIGYAYGVLGS
ncbi:MAG: hypothetical protein ACK520_12000 [Inhella sp.]